MNHGCVWLKEWICVIAGPRTELEVVCVPRPRADQTVVILGESQKVVLEPLLMVPNAGTPGTGGEEEVSTQKD